LAVRDGRAFVGELERALAHCPPGERKFVFVGVLNRHLPRRSQAVLVGGGAVELYTAGAYVTGDVDLVGDRESILPLLEAAGFRRVDRLFMREDLELAVDLVGLDLRSGETVKETVVRGYNVPTVSREDVIVDRLLAAEYWKSRTDWEQAVLLYQAHQSTLDRTTLEARARANGVEGKLKDLIAQVSARGGPRR